MKTVIPRWMEERFDACKQAEAQRKALRKKANAAKRAAAKRKEKGRLIDDQTAPKTP